VCRNVICVDVPDSQNDMKLAQPFDEALARNADLCVVYVTVDLVPGTSRRRSCQRTSVTMTLLKSALSSWSP
jgi:hypothetical protein